MRVSALTALRLKVVIGATYHEEEYLINMYELVKCELINSQLIQLEDKGLSGPCAAPSAMSAIEIVSIQFCSQSGLRIQTHQCRTAER